MCGSIWADWQQQFLLTIKFLFLQWKVQWLKYLSLTLSPKNISCPVCPDSILLKIFCTSILSFTVVRPAATFRLSLLQEQIKKKFFFTQAYIIIFFFKWNSNSYYFNVQDNVLHCVLTSHSSFNRKEEEWLEFLESVKALHLCSVQPRLFQTLRASLQPGLTVGSVPAALAREASGCTAFPVSGQLAPVSWHCQRQRRGDELETLKKNKKTPSPVPLFCSVLPRNVRVCVCVNVKPHTLCCTDPHEKLWYDNHLNKNGISCLRQRWDNRNWNFIYKELGSKFTVFAIKIWQN